MQDRTKVNTMQIFRRGLAVYFEKAEYTEMFLGFFYLGLYSAQVLVEMSKTTFDTLEAISNLIYLIFVVDLILRAVYAGRELATIAGAFKFLRSNWLAIAATVLPAFRSLRVLRVLLVLRGLGPFLTTRASKVGMVVGITLPLVLYTSAISVFDAERNAEGANITNFPDAFWWAIASVTTVGYGDRFPVTDEGRFIATMLMVVGIGLFSALTALLAAWVMGENQKKEEAKLEQAIKEDFDELEKELSIKKAPAKKPVSKKV
jgi:voltage-gated potassium channel